jgi:purine nucleoside permease
MNLLLRAFVTMVWVLAGACTSCTPALADVIRPRVVIVAYFEIGNDTGDRPGELQYWVERDHLTRIIEVPGMTHHVRANADGSEIALAVGPAQLRPAVNLTVLGFSPLFDLRKSYWLINGIAGASPHETPLGSAFWTDYIVNGGQVHSIDTREIPQSWPDGTFWLTQATPDAPRVPAGSPDDVRTWPATGAHIDTPGIVVRMNPQLVHWAYVQTNAMTLVETPEMRAAAATFPYAAAHEPPTVRIGAQLATEAFWHGRLDDDWAHRWVPYATDGMATYATTAENDSGAMDALYALTLARRADWNRALLLRTVSNYDMPPPGVSAAQSVLEQQDHAYQAFLPALENAYAVGHQIVRLLLRGIQPST